MNPCSNKCDLESPTRNNYFYGKRLDAYHFQLETDYCNNKRSLINRCVHGMGVVCGLDVDPCTDQSVWIQPGLALDGEGREVIVPEPYELKLMPDVPTDEQCPERSEGDAESQESREGKRRPTDSHAYDKEMGYRKEREEKWFKIHLCYQECLDEPELIHTSDHCNTSPVQPSTVLEGFEIGLEPGKFESPCDWLKIPDVITEIRGSKSSSPKRAYELCYHSLVKNVVSKPCCHDSNHWNPCIPLANVCMVKDGDHWRLADNAIDIMVRPIVLSNENLFQLILSLILDR